MAGRLIATGLAALAFASSAAAQSNVLDEAAEGLRADHALVHVRPHPVADGALLVGEERLDAGDLRSHASGGVLSA